MNFTSLTLRGSVATLRWISPILMATTTLRFPANYRTAANAKRKPAQTRQPAYVNPTGGNLLDIYVGGVLVKNLDVPGVVHPLEQEGGPVGLAVVNGHRLADVKADRCPFLAPVQASGVIEVGHEQMVVRLPACPKQPGETHVEIGIRNWGPARRAQAGLVEKIADGAV